MFSTKAPKAKPFAKFSLPEKEAPVGADIKAMSPQEGTEFTHSPQSNYFKRLRERLRMKI
jgi:hypothetical protein